MRFKVLLIGTLLLASLWLFQRQTNDSVQPQQADHEVTGNPTLPAQSQSSMPDTNSLDSALQETDSNSEVNKLNNQQQLILDEMAVRQFSEDPYLEIKSLAWQYGTCGKQDEFSEMFGADPGRQQNDLLEKIYVNCEQARSDYPNLIKLYANNDWQDLFKAQSQLGKLYSLRKAANSKEEIREYTQSILTGALQTQNGALLLEETLLGYLDHNNLTAPVTQLLGTGDLDYAHEVNRTALTLLACQFNQGVSCQDDGMFMLFNCAYQQAFCGRDYTTWYAINALPGMQLDVQIMIDYYQQISLSGR